ncbi:MAG: HAD-IIB family hydrolase [Verrucomicrobiota bacterium]
MNRPDIKLFSTDLDGTILGIVDAVDRFKTAWEQLLPEECPLLVYNSGRRVDDIMTFVTSCELPKPDYVIGGVGSEIYDFKKSEWMSDFHRVLQAGWDYETVKSVTGRIAGIEPQPDEFLHEFKSSWYLYNATTTQLNELRQHLQNAGMETEVVYSSQQDLDVLPALANKGNALKWLCQHLGISLNQCVVAGDTGNDSAMFLVDGVFGIVPGNAQLELVEQLANRKVYHAKQEVADGILEGLSHYGVINAK